MKTELKTAAKAKTVAKPKADAKAKPAVKAKTETKPEQKKKLFALVAGTTVAITHKFLGEAINRHVKKGNLKKSDKGVAITEQGVVAWNAERVVKNPATFQEIAGWMHGDSPVPAKFNGNKTLEHAPAATGIKFPNAAHWGGFSNAEMRLAFAAIWAK